MTISRRRMIALIGGGVITAAALPTVGFLVTRDPTLARAPWAAAGNYTEPRMRALSFAILAPNPHNRQPWQAKLVGDDTIDVFRDVTRNLPYTDPFDRQLTIGMGCFLELLHMAAAETGHLADIMLFPEGEAGPVARVKMRPDAGKPDPLFLHVLTRRTNRQTYENRPLSSDVVDELSAHARIITNATLVEELRDLTVRAWKIEAETPQTMRESVELTRVGKAEINMSPDGISLVGPFLETLSVLGMLRPEDQLDPTSSGFRQAQDIINTGLRGSFAYVTIVTDRNTRADQIDAGRQWMRVQLAATGLGLAMQPVSQALQEFAEMADEKLRLEALIAQPGQTVQMLSRIGYGPRLAPAPRWPLESRMIPA